MDPTGREQHQLCTTLNVKRFMENFLDEQKGKGPYVDALSKKENYSPVFPAKLDSVELPGDTPHDNGERLYVSIGSMQAEYVALSQAARKLLEFRYLLEDIGFPQSHPTPIYEDNMSAINLAIAPHITRKSRHIHTRHHFIRDLVNQKLAVIQHVPTKDMLADFFTKPYGPKNFKDTRARLFNQHSGGNL